MMLGHYRRPQPLPAGVPDKWCKELSGAQAATGSVAHPGSIRGRSFQMTRYASHFPLPPAPRVDCLLLTSLAPFHGLCGAAADSTRAGASLHRQARASLELAHPHPGPPRRGEGEGVG